jgi:TorA maturation chaperone TorD
MPCNKNLRPSADLAELFLGPVEQPCPLNRSRYSRRAQKESTAAIFLFTKKVEENWGPIMGGKN